MLVPSLRPQTLPRPVSEVPSTKLLSYIPSSKNIGSFLTFQCWLICPLFSVSLCLL